MKNNAAKPLSVCIFSSFYPPVYSGSAIHCADLADNLARRGCHVTVITSRVTAESPEYETTNGVDIYRLPAIKLPRLPIALNFPWLNISFSPANVRRVRNILKNNPPDVLHLHNHMFDSALHAVDAARKFNLPLVLTVHSIIKHTNPFYDFALHFIDRFILKRLVVGRADVVICQDDIIAEYVRNTFDARNIALIPYGITPLKQTDPQKTKALRRKYTRGDGPILLSLGHLHETRDRRELIAILPRLLTVFPALKVLIVGYIGTDSTARLARESGVQDSVILTGAVPHADVVEFLDMADLEAHWFDQKHPHKTPGIAGQEVMMAGRVLVTNAPENIYGEGVLRNDENVVLINPADANALFAKLSEMLADEDKRWRIGAFAKRTAEEHFSWQVVGGRMLEIYRSICRE